MLSPDGRCKAFDAARRRLSSAARAAAWWCSSACPTRWRDGDRVHRGDPRRRPSTRTAAPTASPRPTGRAQEAVLRGACRDAGVAPGAGRVRRGPRHRHAAGRPDRVPARWARCSAPGRPADSPCAIGSVKTNIGHLEAAAGIAGLIKVVLALQPRRDPASLHFETPNPEIAFERAAGSRCTTSRGPGRASAAAALAGVSSFGFGGTNAHVVLEEAAGAAARRRRRRRAPAAPAHRCRRTSEPALSGAGPARPRALAAGHEVPLADVCLHRQHRPRAPLKQRWPRSRPTRDELARQLAAVRGPDAAGVSRGQRRGASARGGVPVHRPGLAVRGDGARELYETQPVFRAALERCGRRCDGRLEPAAARACSSPTSPARSLPDDTACTAAGAVRARVRAGRALAVAGASSADAVLGHSVGEYAAACVAGVFRLEDGAALVAARGPADGGSAPERRHDGDLRQRVRVALEVGPVADQVSIAAVNGPLRYRDLGAPAAVETVAAGVQAARDPRRAPPGLPCLPLPPAGADARRIRGPGLQDPLRPSPAAPGLEPHRRAPRGGPDGRRLLAPARAAAGPFPWPGSRRCGGPAAPSSSRSGPAPPCSEWRPSWRARTRARCSSLRSRRSRTIGTAS